MKKKFPTISIIFPTFNAWKQTQACLESIQKLDYPQNLLEIIIVDNGSTDGSLQNITNFQFPVSNFRLIKNNKNLGFAKAVNQGVRQADGEFILITNNDIVFNCKCLIELTHTLIKHSQLGAVGPQIKSFDGKKILMFGFRLNPYLAYHQHDLSNTSQERNCDFLSGSCLLTKRNLFLKMAGFDENFFFYFEDLDFSLRLKKAGYLMRYQPKAIVYHHSSQTIMKEKTTDILALNYRGRWRCVLKHANLLAKTTSFLFLLFISGLRESYSTRQNVFKQILAGLLYNLKRND